MLSAMVGLTDKRVIQLGEMPSYNACARGRRARLEVVEVDELVRLRHRLGVLPLRRRVSQILPRRENNQQSASKSRSGHRTQ